jgi:uncharacterized protein YjiS (DUF1127 family)
MEVSNMTTSTLQILSEMTLRELAVLPRMLWDHFQERHVLSNLTDDQRNDTGLTKRDIERECSKGFWSKLETMSFAGQRSAKPDFTWKKGST